MKKLSVIILTVILIFTLSVFVYAGSGTMPILPANIEIPFFSLDR